MQPESSRTRPSIADALDRVLRDVEPALALSVQDEPASLRVPARYFAPGDYSRESDWWEKQLAHRG
jgi:hypothetical protein